MLLLAPRWISLVVLVLLAPLAGARAATIGNWPAETFGYGFGEPGSWPDNRSS